MKKRQKILGGTSGEPIETPLKERGLTYVIYGHSVFEAGGLKNAMR